MAVCASPLRYSHCKQSACQPAPPSWVSMCPWAKHLTLTAPDELAVALHGWLCRRCVYVCINRCKSLWMKASAACPNCNWCSYLDQGSRLPPFIRWLLGLFFRRFVYRYKKKGSPQQVEMLVLRPVDSPCVLIPTAHSVQWFHGTNLVESWIKRVLTTTTVVKVISKRIADSVVRRGRVCLACS